MRYVISHNISYEQHREPDTHHRKYQVQTIVARNRNKIPYEFLRQTYHSMQQVCRYGSKHTHQESQHQCKLAVRKMALSP